MSRQRDDRSGYGDDQGTRVGRPQEGRAGEAPDEYPGVREPDAGTEAERRAADGTPGGTPRSAMGSEAAEGIHGAREAGENGRDAAAPSSLSETGTGRESVEGETRSASEPLVERERESGSSYGGAGGEPKRAPDGPH
jgi:hypothetical protein